MASQCWSVVRGKRLRITRVDGCCRPVCGERAYAVTEGFVDVSYSFNINEEEEIEQLNANGDVCVYDTTCPSIQSVSIEATLCGVDPELMEIMTGNEMVANFAGDNVGFRVGENIRCDGGFALELWSGTPDADCEDFGDPLPNFGYFATPCVINGIMGDFSIEAGVANFTVSGRTRRGSGWGRGPFDVVPIDIAGTPGRLLETFGDNHLHMQLTTVPPPEATCGAQDGPEITVEVLTDADGDGVFTANETAACAGDDVPVQVNITGVTGREATALENATLSDGTDTYDLDAGGGGFSGPAPGTSIAPGATVTYTGTLVGWSPANQAAKALVATIEHQGATSGMHCSDTGSARVNTMTPSTQTRFTMAASTMDACPNPTQMTGSDGTTVPLIGSSNTCGTSAAGLASLAGGPAGMPRAGRTFAYDGSSDVVTALDIEYPSAAQGIHLNLLLDGATSAGGWTTEGPGNTLTAWANSGTGNPNAGTSVFTVAVADGDTDTLTVAYDRSTNEIVHLRNGAEVARTAYAQAAPVCGANVAVIIGNNGTSPDPIHYTEWTVESAPSTTV